MRRALVAVGIALACGCSLFTSLDGFREDIIVVEGGASDGAPSGDAPVSGDGGSFCATLATPALLCADYDDGNPLGPFTSISTNAGGGIAVDQKALLVTIPATPGVFSAACVVTSIAGARSEAEFEADFVVDQEGAPHVDLIEIGNTGAGNLSLEVGGGRLILDEDFPTLPDGGFNERKRPIDGPLPSGPFHVRWRLSQAGTGGQSEIFVNGTSVGIADVITAPFLGSGTIEIGDCSAQLTSPSRIRMDNLTVRVK